jgi:hypothetical protein
MDVYTRADTLILMDDQVLEVFRQYVAGSYRIPLTWAAADLAPSRKGDSIRVRIGRASDLGGPFYDPKLISEGAYSFDIPAGDESPLRAFLDEAMRRGGRAQ